MHALTFLDACFTIYRLLFAFALIKVEHENVIIQKTSTGADFGSVINFCGLHFGIAVVSQVISKMSVQNYEY